MFNSASYKIIPGVLTIISLFLFAGSIHAQEPAEEDSKKVSLPRLGVVSGIAASTTVGSYFYYKKAWWSEQAVPFHFDQGRDLLYARNLDKFAHFLGGVVTSDIFKDLLIWSRVPEETSLWAGAAFGSFIQASIEIKDGFAPRWGFSKWDVILGSAGSLYPVAEHYIKPFGYFDLKMSYYKRTNRYFEYDPNGHPIDDYINQTYWLSVKPDDIFKGRLKDIWPDFLALACGVSIDETTNGQGEGNHEIILALDYDLEKILKKKDSPFWRSLKHYLNYIKFPAPAIRLTPDLKLYGFYM